MNEELKKTFNFFEKESFNSYPSPTTIISYDKNENAVSIFSDNNWDFTRYIGNINHNRKLHFDFIDFNNQNTELSATLLYESKLIMYGLFYCETNSSKTSYITTTMSNIRYVKMLALICQKHNLPLHNLKENPIIFNEIYKNLCSKSKEFNVKFLSFLKKISSLTNTFKNHDFSLKLDQIKKISKIISSTVEKPVKQHLVIPSRIYYEIYNKSNTILDYYLQNKNKIEKFFMELEKSKEKINKSNYSQIFKTLINQFKLNDFCNFYQINTKMQFYVYLTQLLPISFLRILLFTGMRKGEVGTLPKNCLNKISLKNQDIYIINGYTNKFTQNGFMKTSWVTSYLVTNAIKTAQSVSKIFAQFNNIQIVDDENTPLFIGLTDKSNSALYPIPIKSAFLLNKSIDYFNIDINVSESDLQEVIDIQPFIDPKSYKVHLNKPFPISAHQFRRSLTVYCTRSGIVKFSTLKAQLKHISFAMTYYYSHGASLAKDITFDETLMKDINNEIKHNNFLSFKKDIVEAKSPLFGSEGSRLEIAKRKPQPPIFLVDENAALKAIKNGKLHYHETPIGGCANNSRCEKISNLSLTACISCKYAIFSDRSVASFVKIKELYLKQLSLYPDDSPYFLYLKHEISEIEKALIKRKNFLESQNV